jgi:hypothetical protein
MTDDSDQPGSPTESERCDRNAMRIQPFRAGSFLFEVQRNIADAVYALKFKGLCGGSASQKQNIQGEITLFVICQWDFTKRVVIPQYVK